MILRAKHIVLLLLVPFSIAMGSFIAFDGMVAKAYFFCIAIVPAFMIYWVMKKNPDSSTVIFGEEPK